MKNHINYYISTLPFQHLPVALKCTGPLDFTSRSFGAYAAPAPFPCAESHVVKLLSL